MMIFTHLILVNVMIVTNSLQDLLYVVPFVAKVLESCAESRVFKPPNPWTMGIMAVLSELHALPDLKVCGGVGVWGVVCWVCGV